MARNNVFPFSVTRRLSVPAGVKSGEAVHVGAINGVALVDRASSADYRPTADNPVKHLQNPGAWGGGNADGQATVALDGAWEFDITAASAPAEGDQVYITSGRALTVTAGSNSKFGVIIQGAGGKAPVDNGNGTFKATVDVRQY